MKPRVIAYYLPQFHPTPENDEWWGKGFTEWTNVGKAKPLFRGHYQPRVPADLGYYDLRVPETRMAQANMAREYGIEGFCYWHYWFGNGKRLLERPFYEVLESGQPDFPFCLAWANESWKGFAHGLKNRNMLIEQLYPGIDDYTNHFYEVLPAFKDKRYICIDGKPLFVIYKPLANPEVISFIKTWRRLAELNNLAGIHFVGHNNNSCETIDDILSVGVDAVNTVRLMSYTANRHFLVKVKDKLNSIIRNVPKVYTFEFISKFLINRDEDGKENVYPSLISGWDHSPRSGNEALVLTNFTPKVFEKHISQIFDLINMKNEEHQIVFLKSWNEWAEGNYIEPDLIYKSAFLETLGNKIRG